MKICEVCGNEENNKSKFCSKCGGELKSDNGKVKVGKKHCPECNKHFELEKEYCSDCGTKLEKVEVEEKRKSEKNIKDKKKRRLIIILSSIAIILAAIFFIGVQEQQRQEELARQTLAAKKEYFITYNKIMGRISVIKFVLDLDASQQSEVFRKNAYGDLSGAVKKYREKYASITEGYEANAKKIGDLINKELVKNSNLLSEDAEYKKLNELLDKTIADLNSYLEDTTNPTGNYYTYSESVNEKSKKLKQSYSEMETKFKYILEANGMTLKDVKVQDDKGKTQNK